MGDSLHTAKEQESLRRRGSGDNRGSTSTEPVNERSQVTMAPC